MLDLLKWVFEGFWRFLGVLTLLWTTCAGLAFIARSLPRRS